MPSPVGRWLKGIVTSAQEGNLEMEYLVRPEMCNPAGTLHGGMIATMMDDLMGGVMFSLNDPYFKMSINLNVDYFATATEGEKVRAHAELVKQGKQLLNAQCSLYNEKGKLLARGYSNLMRSNIKVPLP